MFALMYFGILVACPTHLPEKCHLWGQSAFLEIYLPL